MKFEVDVERLVDYGMPLNQYLLCQIIYQQNDKILTFYMEQFGKFVTTDDFNKLLVDEYLGLHDPKRGYVFSNLFVTKNFINRFIEKPTVSKVNGECVEDWIDIWYDLFPKGIKSGGYLVRSDKNGCLNKMKKFVKKNPEFNKEIILKATYDYLQYYRMRNWGFVSLAHYFIEKNNTSILAGQCELIVDKMKEGKDVDLNINQYMQDNSYSESFSDNIDRL